MEILFLLVDALAVSSLVILGSVWGGHLDLWPPSSGFDVRVVGSKVRLFLLMPTKKYELELALKAY